MRVDSGDVWIRTGVSIDALHDDPVLLELDPPRSLARSGDQIYCFEDTCTHEDFSLSDGFLDGDIVECAYHFARFCLRTGDVVTQPARRGLHVYDVRVEGGEIWVASAPRTELPTGRATSRP